MTTYDARKYRRWKSAKLISEMMEYIASLQQDWARERFNLLERAIGAETERDQLKVKLYADQDRNQRAFVGGHREQPGRDADGGDAGRAGPRNGASSVGIGAKIGGAEAQGGTSSESRIRYLYDLNPCSVCGGTTYADVGSGLGHGLRCVRCYPLGG